MELSGKRNKTANLFLYSGISLLAIGMLFGLLGAFQYITPGFIKDYLSFEKVRPLHVSSVVFWIILAAVGSVLNYFQEYSGRKIYSATLVKIQYWLFIAAIFLILVSYIFGIFGGREYWEFHPILAIPIVTAWILFLFNFFKSFKTFKNQPVFVWMWLTGVVFFLFTFIESYLWIIPYFRQNIINDMTVQWKSYGSMVGSWNMLIYGCSIYLIDKISGDKHYGVSKMGFAIYFLGLLNLMFNWGHHIYTLPTLSYIKYISYLVSMTELILFFRILYQWKSSLNTARKNYYHIPYRFLMAADVWVFLTLTLAIAMSIPAINLYTHGTHVTVAHTMGATIGINTFLLFAFVFDILWDKNKATASQKKWFEAGYWLVFIALPVFWISLIIAGVLKAKWQMSANPIPFSMMMHSLKPYFIVFFISGIFLFSGFFILIILIFKNGLGKQVAKKQINLIYYSGENIL
ncbi:MAG: cbb3-type cytochrome c oxidase subunit I [Ginsengibacter sp.]